MSIPQLVEIYEEQIRNNQGVELVMLNVDRSEQAFMAWASQAKFPWPLLWREDFEKGVSKRWWASCCLGCVRCLISRSWIEMEPCWPLEIKRKCSGRPDCGFLKSKQWEGRP